jgi:hypothetical protein
MLALYNATPGTEPFAELRPNDVLELQGYKFNRLRAVGSDFLVLDPSEWGRGMNILTEWVRNAGRGCVFQGFKTLLFQVPSLIALSCRPLSA